MSVSPLHEETVFSYIDRCQEQGNIEIEFHPDKSFYELSCNTPKINDLPGSLDIASFGK